MPTPSFSSYDDTSFFAGKLGLMLFFQMSLKSWIKKNLNATAVELSTYVLGCFVGPPKKCITKKSQLAKINWGLEKALFQKIASMRVE